MLRHDALLGSKFATGKPVHNILATLSVSVKVWYFSSKTEFQYFVLKALHTSCLTSYQRTSDLGPQKISKYEENAEIQFGPV